MTHHDERPAVRVQRVLQMSDADQIEVVGRFVEQQQMRRRFGEQHAHQGRAQSLAAGQRARPGAWPASPRSRNCASRCIRRCGVRVGAKVAEVLVHRAVGIQQVQPLGQVRDPPVPTGDRAGIRREVPADDAQQRGLAGAVGPGQRDAFRSGDREVDTSRRQSRRTARASGRPLRGRPCARTEPRSSGRSSVMWSSSRAARSASSRRARAASTRCQHGCGPTSRRSPAPAACGHPPRSGAARRRARCASRCRRGGPSVPGPAASAACPA